MPGFSDVMQQRSDAELLEITTTRRNDYQPEALAAAEAELKARNVSSPEPEIILQHHNEPTGTAYDLTSIEDTGFNLKAGILQFFNRPVKEQVQFVTVVLAIFYILYFFFNREIIGNRISNIRLLSWMEIMRLSFVVVFPAVALLFLSMRKAGWILMAGLVSFTSVMIIADVYRKIIAIEIDSHREFDLEEGDASDLEMSSETLTLLPDLNIELEILQPLTVLLNIYRTDSPWTAIFYDVLKLVLFAVVLIFLCLRATRSAFNVTAVAMRATIISCVVLAYLSLFARVFFF